MAVEAELIGRLAMWLGRPTTTWRVTASAKSVELQNSPINTPPYRLKSTHTPHFVDSTSKALFLSVVARCSLVSRVAMLYGPKGLLASREPSS
jgi:hypothetical protein